MNAVVKYTLVSVGTITISSLAGVLASNAFQAHLPGMVALFVPILVAALTALANVGALFARSPLEREAVQELGGDPVVPMAPVVLPPTPKA